MGTRGSNGTASEFVAGRNELRERRRACVRMEMGGGQRCDLVVLLRGQNQARVTVFNGLKRIPIQVFARIV